MSYFSVRCSIKSGIEFKAIESRVKKIVQEEKRHLRKIWPCLTGHLEELKAIIINVRFCHPVFAQPIIDEMHVKFAEHNWSTTRILEWIASEFKSVPAKTKGRVAMDIHRWGRFIYYAYVLENVIIHLQELHNIGLLKEIFGRKCYKKLTKPCI